MKIWVSIAYLASPMSAIPETRLCFAGLIGSVSRGSSIFFIAFEPKEPLYFLTMYLASLLRVTPYCATLLFDPWVNYTSSGPGIGAVYSLLVKLTTVASGLTHFIFILAIVDYSFLHLFVLMLKINYSIFRR